MAPLGCFCAGYCQFPTPVQVFLLDYRHFWKRWWCLCIKSFLGFQYIQTCLPAHWDIAFSLGPYGLCLIVDFKVLKIALHSTSSDLLYSKLSSLTYFQNLGAVTFSSLNSITVNGWTFICFRKINLYLKYDRKSEYASQAESLSCRVVFAVMYQCVSKVCWFECLSR